MTKKGICKFCGKEKGLIGAHIIPQNFYINRKEKGYRSLDITDGSWQQWQAGLKDYNILCTDCDNETLGKFDNEAYRVLFTEIYKHKEPQDEPKGFLYHLTKDDYDYTLLRKFFISILWRASISKMRDFSIIDLGPYEKFALEILQDKKEHKDLFKILIFKMKDEKSLSEFVYINSYKEYQTTVYDICMAGYNIIIFVKNPRLSQKDNELINKISLNKEELYIAETEDVTTQNINNLTNLIKCWEYNKNKGK